MKKILLLATSLYLLLATLTYHPDNKLVLNWASQDNGKVWNIWSYGEKNLQKVGQFNYPPLHFYLDKIQYFIARPIGGDGFYEWLSSPNSTDGDQANLSRYSFAIKVPIIMFALFSAVFLYLISKQFGASETNAKLIISLWLFNPITLYSIPIMGQNDVMAITFFLAGWYLLNSKKIFYSAIVFGLGASVKMFPLMWLPFLLLVDNSLSIKKRFKILFGAIATYILTLIPFISNATFRENAFNSGIDRFFIAKIDLGFNDQILLVPILIMLIIYGITKFKKINDQNQTVIHQASILLLLNMVMLFFNHFHPQWITWMIPFWAIWIANQKKEYMISLVLLSISVFFAWLIIVILFNDSFLTLGLLVASNPHLASLPAITNLLLSRNIDLSKFSNYAHTWLSGLTLMFLIYWLSDKYQLVHSPLNLPKLKFLNYKKIYLYLLSVFLSISIVFGIVFVGNVIPVNLSGSNPIIVSYPYFTQEINSTFTGKYKDLNRVDLYFSNEELKNRDLYQIVITNEDGQTVLNQDFSGFNTGFESVLRFNIPSQPDSLGQKYFIKITPPKYSEHALRIGSTLPDDQNSFAIKSFYQQPRGKNLIKFAFDQGISESLNLINQLGLVYLFIAILLWFSL